MKKTLCGLAVLAVMAAGLSATRADTVAFNSSLASPDFSQNQTLHPGWYHDTNPNAGFTVDTGGTTKGSNPPGPIETGLRARQGTGAGVINSSTDLYKVVAGTAWSYDFSIDLRPGDIFGLNFASTGITSLLTITDTTNGHTFSLDPTSLKDDIGYNNSGNPPTFLWSTNKMTMVQTEQTGDWGAQNSETLSSTSGTPLPGYDINALDLYTITLTVDQGTTVLSSDTIQVQVTSAVPLPSGVWMGLAMLPLAIGMGAIRKRRSAAF